MKVKCDNCEGTGHAWQLLIHHHSYLRCKICKGTGEIEQTLTLNPSPKSGEGNK